MMPTLTFYSCRRLHNAVSMPKCGFSAVCILSEDENIIIISIVQQLLL